ncbi:MAG: PepSY-like domain-containing protein [Muribaculaceae bacterium]|nr:PepSY-like domain-containing protein [Muribaculaceae bacterium]
MNKYSKILFLAIISLMTMGLYGACSNDNEREPEYAIQIEDLPSAAQNFLSKYFPGVAASKIEEEKATDIIVYEVELENGFEIVFNSEGEWQQIDAPDYQTVPKEVLPQPVAQVLSEQYPNYGVIEINTTGEGWKVELSNSSGHVPGESGIDLWINMSGEITQTSQNNV